MRSAWSFLCFLADVLVPRFLSEDVALELVGPDPKQFDSYAIVCAMADVQPGERFDAVAEVDSFTWLSLGITYRIGNVRPWPAEVIAK